MANGIARDEAAIEKSVNGMLGFFFACFVPIAIGPKALQLFVVALCCVRVLYTTWRFLRFDASGGFLVAWLGIYLISIVANLPGSSADRIFAAVNTWLIWFFSCLMFLCMRQCEEIDWQRIGRLAFLDICFFAALMIITHLVHFNLALPWDGKVLWKTDWENGAMTLRFTGWLGYSNAVVFLFLFLAPLASTFLAEKRSFMLDTLFVVFLVALVLSCGSRAATPLVLVVGAVMWFTTFPVFDHSGKTRLVVATVLVGATVLVLVACWPEIMGAFNSLLYGRVDSNATRGFLYEQSIAMAFDDSPVVGMGIKNLTDSGAIPYGSHSTYVGLFYRTGFLGIALFAAATFACLGEIVKSGNCRLIDLAWLFSALLFVAFEDVDGVNWVLPVLFVFILFLMEKGIGRTLSMADKQIEAVNDDH